MHIYRVSHYLYSLKIPILPIFFKWIIFLLYNSKIPPECSIGELSKFGHGGIGVVLHAECVIGDRVLIGQGVTIGGSFGSGVPKISSDVWIGPGARIFGDIRVGSNCVIGANSVVTKNIPDNCVVGGVPAKIIKEIPVNSLDVINGRMKLATSIISEMD